MGGLVFGVFLAYLGNGLCQSGDSREDNCGTALVGGALVGGLLGFGVGALIGGQFPKHRDETSPDSVQID
ncbi:MAG TPA: hypothetical protein VGJ36_09330 [Gemmatimonadales bacterium]